MENRIGHVVICVRGGVVQDVVASTKDLQVMIIDYDDEEAVGTINRRFHAADCDPEYIAKTLAGTESDD